MRQGNEIEMLKPGPNTPVPVGTLGTLRDFHPDRGWEIAWETGVSTFFPGDGDEIANRKPAGELGSCDFCPSAEPRWEHRCHDSESVLVAIGAGPPVSMGHGMHGSWAACEACHRLIEAGKRDKLARRAAKKVTVRNPGMPTSLVLATVRQAHRQYWDNRVGPGFPIRGVTNEP